MKVACCCGFLLAVLIAAAPMAVAAPAATQPAADDDAIAQKTQALARQWEERFRQEGLSHLVAPPFVLVGDGGEAALVRYRDHTIFAAANALQAMYFDKKPSEPVLIFLFESGKTYQRLSREWFGLPQVPYFGLFNRQARVMLMNVSTGTGTLTHELTHALIAPDFPDVPDWFNEGLASLYEQCSIGNKTITGFANWRLPPLQQAIAAGKLRPLRELMHDPKFYDEKNVGLNYAQARYLMLYLQHKNLLKRYYKSFRDNAAEDPTGQKSLEKLIAPQKLDEFEEQWRKWVMRLRG